MRAAPSAGSSSSSSLATRRPRRVDGTPTGSAARSSSPVADECSVEARAENINDDSVAGVAGVVVAGGNPEGVVVAGGNPEGVVVAGDVNANGGCGRHY